MEVRAISSAIRAVRCRWCMFPSFPLKVQRGVLAVHPNANPCFQSQIIYDLGAAGDLWARLTINNLCYNQWLGEAGTTTTIRSVDNTDYFVCKRACMSRLRLT